MTFLRIAARTLQVGDMEDYANASNDLAAIFFVSLVGLDLSFWLLATNLFANLAEILQLL